jgi:hypothetical protein
LGVGDDWAVATAVHVIIVNTEAIRGKARPGANVGMHFIVLAGTAYYNDRDAVDQVVPL